MFLEITQNFISLISLATIFLVVLVFVWNIFLQVRISKLRKITRSIFEGNKAKNLEEVILRQTQSIKNLDKDIQELYNISNQINNLGFKSIHKTGLVRFNPFKDVGGDQSFSVALLNGRDNGIVISSLYTREGTRIYAKTIKGGKSEKYPLTDEEKQSIKIALASDSKKVIS